jgi:hypothetical protein
VARTLTDARALVTATLDGWAARLEDGLRTMRADGPLRADADADPRALATVHG